MKRFILLRPVNPSTYGLSMDHFAHITREEYGCDTLISQQEGQTLIFVTSTVKENLELLCGHNDLDGVVLEYTGVFDQVVGM